MSAPHPRLLHGVDLVHVPRLRAALERHAAFEARVFTAKERAYCRTHPDPVPHLAARFAAKEAALKALGLGITGLGVDAALLGVEVVRAGGPPTLCLSGRAARAARRLGVVESTLSLSHDGDTALASVVMLAWGAADGDARGGAQGVEGGRARAAGDGPAEGEAGA